jgi:hypothetical protein
MLFVNYASNAGLFSKQTVADVSHKYDTLFAPANYAFVIWGFIFLMVICFVIFQWVLLKHNDPKNYIGKAGIWLIVSNLANALWIYCWVNEMLGWSVVLIFLLLLSLVVLTLNLRLELDDEPVRSILFVWWPICVYLGWIMVATIACVSAWLVSIGWNGGGLQESVWAIIMIAIASLIYVGLIFNRNMREAAVVGIWAFIAIAIRQWNIQVDISIAAMVASVILFLFIMIHGYKNRHYAIVAKLNKGEWK